MMWQINNLFEDVCQRSDAWSAWSTCSTHGRCVSAHDMEMLTQTYRMEATTYDKGREVMKKMMAEKEKVAAERANCIQSGRCDDLNKPSITGAATACVGGMLLVIRSL